MAHDATKERKDAHLDLCAEDDVAPAENRTLFDCVHLVHDALPELSLGGLDTRSELVGKPLALPLLITGMTGGTARAAQVNRDLALAAEQAGVAFGVGSQRAMLEDAKALASYAVREVAPRVVLLGNLGLQQVVTLGEAAALRLMEAISADGLAVHLNAAQELTQPEGDRDFVGGYRAVEALARALGPRLVVKETGCGIGPKPAKRLAEAGVTCLDVSGLGGTSWVRVEELRASGLARQVGATFAGWGIPTAAAIASVRRAVGPGVRLIASGGLRHGLEVAKALALGADLGGMALPLFRAQQRGGAQAVGEALGAVAQGLKQAMLLTGSRTVADLKQAAPVVTGDLKDWLSAL